MSEPIKRYWAYPASHYEDSADGPLVLHTDHLAALESLRSEKDAEIAFLKRGGEPMFVPANALESARAEAKRLQSALDHMMDESRFPPEKRQHFMGRSKSEMWDLIRAIEDIYGPNLSLSAAATRLKAERASGFAEALRRWREEMRVAPILNLPLKDKP